jgi:hypothetical protein
MRRSCVPATDISETDKAASASIERAVTKIKSLDVPYGEVIPTIKGEKGKESAGGNAAIVLRGILGIAEKDFAMAKG